MYLSALVPVAVVGVLLFWSIGAYNRLMRLRSAVLLAFGVLDAQLMRLLALLEECDALCARQDGVADAIKSMHATLAAAASQLNACLGAARAQPLRPAALAALVTARGTLASAWQSAAQVAGAEDWFDPMLGRRAQHMLHLEQATVQFNDAATHYSTAVRQFPARGLAWLFGFKPIGQL